uniref:Uncharacterized protein n=1 Tax=Anguilla anguilla TaxID=7936 RepID=A0A0E9RTC9_ANGAN
MSHAGFVITILEFLGISNSITSSPIDIQLLSDNIFF